MATLSELSASPVGVIVNPLSLRSDPASLEMRGMVRSGDFSKYVSPRHAENEARARDLGRLDGRQVTSRVVEIFDIDVDLWRTLNARIWSHGKGPWAMNAREACDAIGNVGFFPCLLAPLTLACAPCICRGIWWPHVEPYSADAAARHSVYVLEDGIILPGMTDETAKQPGNWVAGHPWLAPATPPEVPDFLAYDDVALDGLRIEPVIDVGLHCTGVCFPCGWRQPLTLESIRLRSVSTHVSPSGEDVRDVDRILVGYKHILLLQKMILAGKAGQLARGPTNAASPSLSPIKDKLEELDDLRDFSVITQEEYDAQRAAIFAARRQVEV